jgi:hypothetical protein
MVRYVLTAVGALAIMSGVAFADSDAISGSKTTTITPAAPHGMEYHKSIVKHHVNRYGNLVTKKKTYTKGLSGSSMTRSRTWSDPDAGGTVTKSRTTIER